MRFCNKSHAFHCGIDLHARWMYICVIDQAGETVYHRNHKTRPEQLLRIRDKINGPFGDRRSCSSA